MGVWKLEIENGNLKFKSGVESWKVAIWYSRVKCGSLKIALNHSRVEAVSWNVVPWDLSVKSGTLRVAMYFSRVETGSWRVVPWDSKRRWTVVPWNSRAQSGSQRVATWDSNGGWKVASWYSRVKSGHGSENTWNGRCQVGHWRLASSWRLESRNWNLSDLFSRGRNGNSQVASHRLLAMIQTRCAKDSHTPLQSFRRPQLTDFFSTPSRKVSSEDLWSGGVQGQDCFASCFTRVHAVQSATSWPLKVLVSSQWPRL